MDSDFKKAAIVFGTSLAFVVTAVYLTSWVTGDLNNGSKENNNETATSTIARSVVSCSPDFLSYTKVRDGEGKQLSLIGSRQSMFADNGKFVNEKLVLAKSETVTSKVACGYLFVKAGSGKGALHSYENVVIDPKGFGGHINPASAISINENEQSSQYLYPLNKIEYWPTHLRQIVYTADWAALFNVQDTIPILVALNMEDKSGFIDEVTIAYKCWNPETGEENRDCELKIDSRDQVLSDTLK